jgi:hypothetical protein
MPKYVDSCQAVFEKINDFTFQRIRREIDAIKNQLETPEDNKPKDQLYAFQQRVIGALEYYQLPESEKYLKQEVLRLIECHENKYKYFDRMFNFMVDTTGMTFDLEFERIWINVQRKNEFIPLHQHSGCYSFVLWTEIPFYMENEHKTCDNKVLIKDRSGLFEFVFTDHLGKLTNHQIPVDKTWEGVLCVFPAELHHQVYPFYSSDDLRITISGNLRVAKKAFQT